MMKGVPRLGKNCQLAIHRAALNGRKDFPVLILDGAAPSETARSTWTCATAQRSEAWYPNSWRSLRSTCRLIRRSVITCPTSPIGPATRPKWFGSVAADAGDGGAGIRRSAVSPWAGERVFTWAWKAGFVLVASEERTSYANLLLRVDSTASPLLHLPTLITPELAVELAWMGHMDEAVVIGRRTPIATGHLAARDRALHAPAGSTVLSVVQALAEVSEPDYCEQPLCFCYPAGTRCLHGCCHPAQCAGGSFPGGLEQDSPRGAPRPRYSAA